MKDKLGLEEDLEEIELSYDEALIVVNKILKKLFHPKITKE